MKKTSLLILLIFILFGIYYRLALTENNNFIFNMDNARDFVDVREMVVLGKLRLIGPTSAIEGVFNGPGWYYLLAIPFILSNGNPYSAIITEIILWAVGGVFLFLLTYKLGKLALLSSLSIWLFSNYIVLATLYSFNPNPVTLLTPLFIYLLLKYLTTGKSLYSLSLGFLGGAFFNFEMNFGIFVPLIILTTMALTNKINLIKLKPFFLGLIAFLLTLLPQVIFNIKHQFIMIHSLFNFLNNQSGGQNFNLIKKIITLAQSFYNVLNSTLFNYKMLAIICLILGGILLIKYLYQNLSHQLFKNNYLTLICISFILVPFIGYLILPVTVNPWHLGGEAVAAIILISLMIQSLSHLKSKGKLIAFSLSILIIYSSLNNLTDFFKTKHVVNNDPSLLRNELAAVDYIYQQSARKNFKAYIYLPSIIDYPYQYLFWWHGLRKYGYTPSDYAYLPKQPTYIKFKDQFIKPANSLESNLIFLIKEPDRRGERHLWENSFKNLPLVQTVNIGSLIIETRQDMIKSQGI